MTAAIDATPDIPDADTDLDAHLTWRNRFARLGSAFYTRLQPQPLPDPVWISRNQALARELGLEETWFASQGALEAVTGNRSLAGSDPMASVYSGHQFGQWAGQLGDGRALLLGELQTPAGGVEIQLKGAGRTPYSRMGDGRAVLRSSIREYLCSEAMQGLGIPTTRALCVTGSDAKVRREEIETAAVVTRTAPSFIRFGHFEHFSYNDQHDELKALADYVIDNFYPACRDAPQPYAALLQAVSERTAHLMAAWQAVGFCHGVMNTDNMSILGLTLDYGPFGFMEAFNPGHICNHSDDRGRYAYENQPYIGLWNCSRLAQALTPLIDAEKCNAALARYEGAYLQAYHSHMRAKLGLLQAMEGDDTLASDLLALLAEHGTDFTIFFRALGRFETTPNAANSANSTQRDLMVNREAFDAWAARYTTRLAAEASVDAERRTRMNRANPKYVLRNHLAQAAIEKAEQQRDFSEIDKLLKLLQHPFDEQPEHEAYAAPPPDWAKDIAVSCSS